MSTATDLHLLGAAQAARAIGDGVVSATDYVAACLARIAEIDDLVQAWSFIDPDYALAQAGLLDEHRARGAPIGRLHGVPVALKDIIDTEDMPTECGSVLHAGRRPSDDATIVRRLRAEGAVVIGKTVTTEFATFAPGKTRNPRNLAHTPGGSSSGSAAAVAAGMVPLAIGTQTNGSVIRPASFCGTVGFKPSFGAISRHGVLRTSRALDQVGVFARSVEDAALLADALFGHDENDPDTRRAARPDLARIAGEDPPLPPRLAYVGTPIADELTDESREAFAELQQLLEIPALAMADAFRAAWISHQTIYEADLAHYLRAAYEHGREQLSASLRGQIERGREVRAPDYLAARERAASLYLGMEDWLEEYDAFVTPSAHGVAPEGLESTGSPAFCTLWTLCGMPAITLPLMRSESGLPIGVQLVGKRGDDARLLRTARWLVERLAEA